MSKSELSFGGHLVAFIDLLGQSKDLKKMYEINWWDDYAGVKDILSSTYGNVLSFRNDMNNFMESFSKQTIPEEVILTLSNENQVKYRELIKTKIHSQNVADSIILSVPLHITNGIIPLKSVLAVLSGSAVCMISSLSNGFCFRAGIEFGPCLFNEDLNEVYGSALSESVAIEKKADFPRIIVGDHLVQYLKDLSLDESLHPLNSGLAKRCLSLICQDHDGLYFVDYLGKPLKNLLRSVDSSKVIKSAIEHINKQLSVFRSDEKIYSKYVRLKEYFLTRSDVWGTTLISF